MPKQKRKTAKRTRVTSVRNARRTKVKFGKHLTANDYYHYAVVILVALIVIMVIAFSS